MRRLWELVFCLFVLLPMVVHAEDLCMDGTLLFREDFGGNDPSDPAVGRTAVSGMSSGYQQIYKLQTSDPGTGMGAGTYLVAKRGYRNSTRSDYSVWHIMDDHTYFGDTTRGYLLEIDGTGSGNDVFYSTVIDGLCAGSKLTFSAYVANLTTAGQYAVWRNNRSYLHPQLLFILTHPETGAELARYDTDTISHDWNNYPKSWRETADWQLVGMNFTVPEGINAVRLSIRNNANGSSTGNDFAIDDIEIRLCLPPIHVRATDEVCAGETVTLDSELDYPYMVYEALYYKWWFSPDSLNWTEIDYGIDHSQLNISNASMASSGWYKVSMGTEGKMDSEKCHTTSEPFKLTVVQCAEPLCMDGTLLFREDFGGNDQNDPKISTTAVPGMSYTQATTDVLGSMGGGKYIVTKQGYCNGNGTSQWHLQDDHTHFGDLTRGYLLEIDGRGDNAAFYSTIIDGLCESSHLTFSAYVANVMTWGMYIGRPGTYAYPRLKFVIADPATDAELATYDTGDIPFDSAFIGDNICWQQSVEWRLVGMNFTVPAGQNSVKLTIYNNATGSNGNDFAIDDIEIRLCAPPVTIDGESEVCTNETATLTANFTNDGTFPEPLGYKWFFSADSVSWETLDETSNVLNISNVQKADSGWYQVAVAGADNIENLNCRAMSAPFILKVKECVDELCVDGTLLFREDFGGNDPSDPDVSMTSVPGMSSQYHNAGPSGPSSGRYTVRKEGWANGIQWHRQDDHTYPDDKTRGYLLEVDGIGGAEPFYSTTIDGLCAGSKLTFSAYVVNVHYAGQINWLINNRGYVYPRMKFVLKDPTTGSVLAEKTTGDILPDPRYTTEEEWTYARENSLSAEWQLIGMNFIVPDGVEFIQMFIYNDVTSNGAGNDFALDDIEIHLCAPPVTIEGESEVCTNTSTTLTANFTNDGTFAEPLAYKWWHSLDSVTWTEIADFNGGILTFSTIQKADSGWYKVAVSGDGNIESVNCRAMSEPFRLRVNECEPPEPPVEELCMDGILLFREDFGGNDPNDPRVSTTPVPGMYSTYTQVFRTESCMSSSCCDCDDMLEGRYTVTKQGYRNSYTAGYSIWHIMDDHTYPDDITRGYFLEVDGKGGSTPIYKTTLNGLCAGLQLSFTTYIANIVTAEQYISWRTQFNYTYPKIKFVITDPQNGNILAQYTTDTIGHDWSLYNTTDSWKQSANWQLVGMSFVVPDGINQVDLSIYNAVNNVRIGNDFALDDIEIHLCMTPDTVRKDTMVCDTIQQIKWRGKTFDMADTLRDTLLSPCGFDSIYYIMKVQTEHCEPPVPPCPEMVTLTADTVVCDTLMPYRWRDTLYTVPATYKIIVRNERDCDSLLYIFTLDTKACCPDTRIVAVDTTVCDTLLPFTWTINGQTFVFEQVETQEREIPHSRWADCIGTTYTVSLDTFHCEHLYPLIVNKYNWQLLLDHTALRKFFPGRTARAYQWYKNDEPVLGAIDDDYAEQNELNGRFQLRIELDNNQIIWSNILEIGEAKAELPVYVHIYDSHGMPVREDQVMHGIYLYRYEQGDKVWTEKKWIP